MNEKLFQEWLARKIVVHCTTKEKSDNFLTFCKQYGLTWSSGDDLKETDYYNNHKEITCYVKDRDGIKYSGIFYYIGKGIPAVSYDEMFKCNDCDICNTCDRRKCIKNDIS